MALGGTLANETASLGTVDQADFDAWQGNFGATGGSGGQSTPSVPEPSTLGLFLLAAGIGPIVVTRRSRFPVPRFPLVPVAAPARG